MVGWVKRKAAGLELCGDGAGTGKECRVGHLSDGETQGKSGSGKDCGAMDGVGQGASKFGVGDGVRSGEIQRPDQRGLVHSNESGGNEVGEADPAHPLSAGAEAATESEAKEGEKLVERTTARPEDDTETEMDNPDPGVGSRLGCGFPFLTEVGQKTISGRRTFIQQVIATISVVADCRCYQEHGGRVAKRKQSRDEASC